MITENYFVDMPHMRKTIKNPRFLSRVYSPQEIKLLMSKNFSPYATAEMYCAKIAFKKAMGVSFNGCSIQEISVLTDYSGSYYLSLSGNTKKVFELKQSRINISCSHSKNLAMSTIVFYS